MKASPSGTTPFIEATSGENRRADGALWETLHCYKEAVYFAWIETAGGVALPPPELGSCGVTISTMVDGARNGNGDFIGQVVGDDKLKIEVSFGMLTPSEMQTLLSLFDRKRGGKFINTFRVFDPRVNDFVYMDMYVGDRSGTPVRIDAARWLPGAWKSVKANLIQV